MNMLIAGAARTICRRLAHALRRHDHIIRIRVADTLENQMLESA